MPRFLPYTSDLDAETFLAHILILDIFLLYPVTSLIGHFIFKKDKNASHKYFDFLVVWKIVRSFIFLYLAYYCWFKLIR